MLSSAILLDTPDQGQEILGSILPAAKKAGLTLRLFAGNDRGIEDLANSIAAGDEPLAFLVGPNLQRPLAAARKVHKLAPLVQIIFLVDGERESELQQDLSLAPMIGNDWSMARLDVDELTHRLGTAARSTTQRRQLRTTLDDINLQITSWPTDNGLAYRRLFISDRYLATILAHAPVAIVSTDPSGIISTWNLGAQQLFQLPESEAIGRRIEDIAAGQWAEEIQSLMQAVASSQQLGSREAACRRADGTTFNVDLVVAPVREEKGGLIGVSVIAHDITERKRADEQLNAINANLESIVAKRTAELVRSNSELERFAYVASHDLQEPLRAVGGFCELLRKRYHGQLDENANEWIDFAVQGAHRMQKMVEGLLTYSRVQSRSKPYEQVDCGLVLTRSIDSLKSSIEDTGAVVEYDRLPTVTGDALQLEQLFQNLISNGIKYQGSDTPRIHVSAERQDNDWLFAVRDNGIGIASANKDKVFDIFRRLHREDEFPGSGLGLALCKWIVERHGGRIWVESKLGEGSTFYFTIPQKNAVEGKGA